MDIGYSWSTRRSLPNERDHFRLLCTTGSVQTVAIFGSVVVDETVQNAGDCARISKHVALRMNRRHSTRRKAIRGRHTAYRHLIVCRIQNKVLTAFEHIIDRAPLRPLERAFPDGQHAPSPFLEGPEGVAVSFSVSPDLPSPELFPCLRPHEYPATVPMPEAAVYEDRRTVFREHQVGPSRQVLAVKTEPQPPGVKSTPDGHLRLRVAPPDARHVEPALSFGEYVRHGGRCQSSSPVGAARMAVSPNVVSWGTIGTPFGATPSASVANAPTMDCPYSRNP